jgi:hypothetical protein
VICPKCKSDRAHRSHRRGILERLVAVVAVYAYRCHACEYRFLRFRYAPGALPELASSTEREIRSTRSSIKWRRKRREVLIYGTGFALFLAFLYYITRQRDSGEGN